MSDMGVIGKKIFLPRFLPLNWTNSKPSIARTSSFSVMCFVVKSDHFSLATSLARLPSQSAKA